MRGKRASRSKFRILKTVFIAFVFFITLVLFQNCVDQNLNKIKSTKQSSLGTDLPPTVIDPVNPEPPIGPPVMPPEEPPYPALTMINSSSVSQVLTRSRYDYAPTVMHDDDGKYKMWWCAGVAGDYIGYAESDSLLNFPADLETYYWPPRGGGQPGSPDSRIYFDGLHVCDPSVIKFRGTYYLYYGSGAFPDEYCMDGATYNADGTINTLARAANDVNNCQSVILDLTSYPQNYSVYATQVGVAKSTDGVNWVRENNGLPIIKTFGDPTKALSFATTYGSLAFPDNTTFPRVKNKRNVYGAGQPSVIIKNNLFYMLYTDTTGVGRRFYDDGTTLGAGVYILRSSDPLFKTNLEEIRCPGDDAIQVKPGLCSNPYWKKLSANEKPTTRYAVLETYSADLSYSDAHGSFLISFRNAADVIQIFLFDDNFKIISQAYTSATGKWRDGPAILHRPDGHLPPVTNLTSDNACSQVNIDIFSALGTDPNTTLDPMQWDISKWSAQLQSQSTCSVTKVANIYEGALIASPNRPLAYITSGKKIFFEVGATAFTLSRRLYNVSNAVLDQIPLGAQIFAGKNSDGSTKMKTVAATNMPACFIDQTNNNQRWQIECMQTITANNSSIELISVNDWLLNPFGGELFCNGIKKFNP